MTTSIKHLILFLFYITCFGYVAVPNKNERNIQTDEKIENNTLFIQIERGGVHDKFILQDTIITYYPSEKEAQNLDSPYSVVSCQTISKKDRNQLISYIDEHHIFELKEMNNSPTNDHSGVFISFNINGKAKKIGCEDFEKGCPEALQYIEAQIITWHSRGLKQNTKKDECIY